MKILTTSTEKQEIKIIPREYPTNITVTLRNENTKKNRFNTIVIAVIFVSVKWRSLNLMC